MTSIYRESIHFIGPSEQISLIPAQLETESFLGKEWLHIPCEHGQNCGPIEEITSSTFRISVFVRLDGSSLDYYFECLSDAFPSLLIIGSSYCPYMGYLEFRAWFGGEPKLSESMHFAGYKMPIMPNASNPEVPIFTEIRKSMSDVLVAAEVSFASGCKTPRKALRILERVKADWDS